MYKFEILSDEPKKGKVRIKLGIVDKVKYIFDSIILSIFSIVFTGIGFKYLFIDGANEIEEIIPISFTKMLNIIFVAIIFSYFFSIFIVSLLNSTECLKKVFFGGEMFEFNKEKNVLLINNKEESSLNDIERVHLRIFHSNSGNEDLHRLYIKTAKQGKKFICQDDNYEAIHQLAEFISRYLTIPMTIE